MPFPVNSGSNALVFASVPNSVVSKCLHFHVAKIVNDVIYQTGGRLEHGNKPGLLCDDSWA